MSRVVPDAPGVTLDVEHLIALRRVALAARSEVISASPGGVATRRRGRGLEIADVREYQIGDDLRQLDRGTTARTGRLHVRLFQEDRDRILILVADFRRSMFWGLTRALRSVAAAEALALIGWATVTDGGRVGLVAITGGDPVTLPPRGRERGMLDVIGSLVAAHRDGLDRARHGETEAASLVTDLVRLDRIAPAGSEIVIASGFDAVGHGFADRLGQIARRRSIRLLNVSALRHAAVPPGRYPIRLGDGRLVQVQLDQAHREAETIDGWPMHTIAAADPPEVTAQTLAQSTQMDRLR